MFRKKIVFIVRECRRLVLKDDWETMVKLRVIDETLAQISGFLQIGIISLNEYKLLFRYVNRLHRFL